jgi:DNA-binding YbaB/EbfC family protein
MSTPDLSAMLAEAQKLQQRLQEAQEDAKKQVVEGAAGGGMVTVEMTGGLELRRVKIDPKMVEPSCDLGMLEDLVAAAVNHAIGKAQALQADAVRNATGGLPIPGLF